MKSVTFLYILHWKWNYQRDVVLEIDFVRFRLQEVCQNVFAARQLLPLERWAILFKIELTESDRKM